MGDEVNKLNALFLLFFCFNSFANLTLDERETYKAEIIRDLKANKWRTENGTNFPSATPLLFDRLTTYPAIHSVDDGNFSKGDLEFARKVAKNIGYRNFSTIIPYFDEQIRKTTRELRKSGSDAKAVYQKLITLQKSKLFWDAIYLPKGRNGEFAAKDITQKWNEFVPQKLIDMKFTFLSDEAVQAQKNFKNFPRTIEQEYKSDLDKIKKLLDEINLKIDDATFAIIDEKIERKGHFHPHSCPTQNTIVQIYEKLFTDLSNDIIADIAVAHAWINNLDIKIKKDDAIFELDKRKYLTSSQKTRNSLTDLAISVSAVKLLMENEIKIKNRIQSIEDSICVDEKDPINNETKSRKVFVPKRNIPKESIVPQI
jgi:hypothetical protein